MDNRGSIIVEMCFVAPVLVGVLFVAINMLLIVMNQSVAAGEAYSVLYNREEYILAGDRTGDRIGDIEDTDTAERVMTENAGDQLVFSEDVKARAYMTDESVRRHGATAAPVLGTCVNEITYTEGYPGISALVNEKNRTKTVKAKREIRNTSNNLRRWQAYGKLLSE